MQINPDVMPRTRERAFPQHKVADSEDYNLKKIIMAGGRNLYSWSRKT